MEETIRYYQFSNQYKDKEACLNFIYYTQVESVKQLLKNCKEIPRIKYLILFGSSLTLACGQASDIDLLVIADSYDEEYTILKVLRQGIKKPMDIIPETVENFKSAAKEGNSLYNEILEKGLMIYERTY